MSALNYVNLNGEIVAVEDKVLRDNVGDVNLLLTTKKTVVDSINELFGRDGSSLAISYDEGSSTLSIINNVSGTNNG
jgi:hypothetical protein